MKEIFSELIKTLKELKTGAKMMGLIVALLCFIIDILLGMQQSLFCDLIRGVYFTIGVFSIIFITNDFFIWLDELKQKREQEKIKQKEKEEQKRIKQEQELTFIKTIQHLKNEELELIQKFVKYGSLSIKLETDNDIDTVFCLRHLLNNQIGIISDRAVISDKTYKLIEEALNQSS